ncbi:unnamed protein product [Paramecium sonneborni]|uniref:Uncharacterized protein n=1 Tax=Paramecium sonneborni TaxID=65129 RepID=A0A8S1NEI3_9CILI|nr:unnamed protein product [Paramecium sonneborni]
MYQHQDNNCFPPPGGLHKGLIIPLVCSCPSECQCRAISIKKWYHSCKNPAFITQYGDIICKNHLKTCKGFFLQDARFRCREANQVTYYSKNTKSQFIMAIAQGLQFQQLQLSDHDLIEFSTSLNMSVFKRWNN